MELSSTLPYEIIDPAERIKRFGIDCVGPLGDGITFRAGHWRPGGEYVQKLTVRNVSSKVKKLKYKLPSTRYFSMAFPEVIILSPGMFTEIDVIFRPLEFEACDDAIYIRMLEEGTGGFYVPVRSRIVKLQLSCPYGMDMGYCATHQLSEQTFELTNTGEVDAPFRWEQPEPFIIEPLSGIVHAGHKQNIRVSIVPEDASVYVSQAKCHVGEGAHADIPDPEIGIKISAIGKYSYIVLSESEIDFGEVISGTSSDVTVRDVVLRNQGVVPAEFVCTRVDSDRDEVFIISPMQGIIPARSELTITVKYTALAMGCCSIDQYAFHTPGRCSSTLTLKGLSRPPLVSLQKDIKISNNNTIMNTTSNGGGSSNNNQMLNSTGISTGTPLNSINFNDVEIGSMHTRVIHLKNHSIKKTFFHIIIGDGGGGSDIDGGGGGGVGGGIFTIYPLVGDIHPQSETSIKLIFKPTKPINFYRRIFVLISEALPQYFDIYGSGYIRAKGEIPEQRPFPLRHSHIQAYRNRVVRGYGGMNPEELDDMLLVASGTGTGIHTGGGGVGGVSTLIDTHRDRGADRYNNTSTGVTDDIGGDMNGTHRDFFAQSGVVGTRPMSVAVLKNPLSRTGEASRVDLAVAHEFFLDETDTGGAVGAVGVTVSDTGNGTVGVLSLRNSQTQRRIQREIVVDKTHLNFGYTPHGTTSDFKTLHVTNRTSGKVTVMWFVPQPTTTTTSSIENDKHNTHTNNGSSTSTSTSSAIFDVIPDTADLNVGETYKFKIYFKPSQSGRNYLNELEAYVFFKNQRTFRLVNDATLVPPWCLAIKALGHTFASGELLAKVRVTGGGVKNGKLVFPMCYIGDEIFQTILLRNESNLSSTYQCVLGWTDGNTNGNNSTRDIDIMTSSSSSLSSFSVKPSVGEIAANSFVLISIRYTAVTNKKCIQLLRCIINGTESESSSLLLEATAGIPMLRFPSITPPSPTTIATTPSHHTTTSTSPDVLHQSLHTIPVSLTNTLIATPVVSGFQGSFYMKPTSIGLSSSSPFILKNSSRLPLRYRITLPPSCTGVLSVYPKQGLLRGNEEMSVMISFAPKEIKRYEFRMYVKVYPIGGPPPRVLDAGQPGKAGPIEVLQTLSVNIIAPGEVGAVIFDPPRAAIEVRLVNTTEEIKMVLENVSDCDLSYRLMYKMEFSSESGFTSVKKFTADVEPLQSTNNRVSSKNSSSNTNGGSSQELLCDKPCDVIQARSRRTLTFVFTPSRAGLYDFIVHAHIHAVDGDGGAIMISNEESALLRMNTCSNFMATENIMNKNNNKNKIRSGDDDNDCDDDNDIDNNNDVEVDVEVLMQLPLVATITCRASFPTLLIEDVRTVGDMLISDVEQLWRQFSLNELNYDLGQSLTDEELRINNQSSPDLSKLKRYKFELTPDVLNSSKQTVVFLIKNNGFLQTNFKLHLPNEKELELESWCDDDELSEEKLREVNIIEELKCLEIEPRQASLAPGESMTITVGYSYNSLKHSGIHKISVLLRVHQGKQLWIDIIGRTLSPGSTIAHIDDIVHTSDTSAAANTLLLFPCTGPDLVSRLSPVPVGLCATDVPMQRTEIVNVSAIDTAYEVDVTALKHLSQSNYGLEILRITNPTGIIPARSSLFLEWFFYPQESKEYEMKLAIRYYRSTNNNAIGGGGGGILFSSTTDKVSKHNRAKQLNTQFLTLTIKAMGFDPRLGYPSITSLHTFVGAVPPVKLEIQHSNTLVELSVDMLRFNIIPQASRAYRLLILRNLSNSEIDYVVDLTDSLLYKCEAVSVTPSMGRMYAHEHVVLHVCIDAKVNPMVFRDRLKVVAREVLKAGKTRDVSLRQSKLLDRIKSRKVGSSGSMSHENLVQRPTFSRSQQIDEGSLSRSRSGSMPSSTNLTHIPPSKLRTHGGGGGGGGGTGSMMSLGDDLSMGGGSRTTGAGTGASTFQRQNSNLSLSSRGSRGSKRGSNENLGPVYGPPHVFVVRLQGEIYTVSTTSRLLSKGPLKSDLSGYIIPQQRIFIPTNTPRDSFHKGVNKVTTTIPPEQRQHEVRFIAQGLLNDMFRVILKEVEIIDHLKDVVCTRAAGLHLPDVGKMVPVGRPIYPLYFSEIMPKKPLSVEMIYEMRLMGIPHVPPHEHEKQRSYLHTQTSIQTQTLSLSHTQKHKDSDTHTEAMCPSLHELDPYLPPSPWSKETGVLLRQASHYRVYKKDFRDTLVMLGAAPKGATYMAIDKLLKLNHDKTVNVHSFIESLPPQWTVYLTSRLHAYTRRRQWREKETRMLGSSALNLSLQRQRELLLSRHSMDIPDEDNSSNIGYDGSSSSSGKNAPGSSSGIGGGNGNAITTTATSTSTSTEERMQMLKHANAVQILQRAMRHGRKARKQLKEMKSRMLRRNTQLALSQNGFLDIVADIMENTMFNLMQEASFGEFDVSAEPVKFMMNKNSGSNTTNGAGNGTSE